MTRKKPRFWYLNLSLRNKECVFHGRKYEKGVDRLLGYIDRMRNLCGVDLRTTGVAGSGESARARDFLTAIAARNPGTECDGPFGSHVFRFKTQAVVRLSAGQQLGGG